MFSFSPATPSLALPSIETFTDLSRRTSCPCRFRAAGDHVGPGATVERVVAAVPSGGRVSVAVEGVRTSAALEELDAGPPWASEGCCVVDEAVVEALTVEGQLVDAGRRTGHNPVARPPPSVQFAEKLAAGPVLDVDLELGATWLTDS
jgi:hypothetical protein